MLGARNFARTFSDRAYIAPRSSIEDLDSGTFRRSESTGSGSFAALRRCGFVPSPPPRHSMNVSREEVPPIAEWLAAVRPGVRNRSGPFLTQGIAAIDLAAVALIARSKTRSIIFRGTRSTRCPGVGSRVWPHPRSHPPNDDSMPAWRRSHRSICGLLPTASCRAGPLLAVQ